jgi:hypothetical protein
MRGPSLGAPRLVPTEKVTVPEGAPLVALTSATKSTVSP